jgi:hypothetical protein
MQVVEVTPWWKTAILALEIVTGLLAALSIYKRISITKKAR